MGSKDIKHTFRYVHQAKIQTRLWEHAVGSESSQGIFWLATMSENIPWDMCTQQRLRLVCPFVQSDKNLH